MTTQVIQSADEMQQICLQAKKFQKSIGFVPTMGALHQGHESLVRQARQNNELVVLSIFINPTQFNNQTDLINYPTTWDQDLKMAQDNRVDYLFYPPAPEMYPDHYEIIISENNLSKQLCGVDRPGHFDGVLTVVNKLLNITQATRAYFGEKDYQQLQLIKKMVAALFIPTEIIAVPTYRSDAGLALSSRNLRLTEPQLQLAPLLHKTLSQVFDLNLCRQKLEDYGFKVQYLQDIGNRRYVAAYLGEIRLIDNILLEQDSHEN